MGWCVEVSYGMYETKKFVNRGFLIGPLCPIYGIGGTLAYLLLSRYKSDPLVLIIVSIFLFSILEYTASWILEKIFKIRWWDYSRRKFNIAGRICLETIIPFGILGMIVVYVLYPLAWNTISLLPERIIYIIASILAIIFVIDFIVSLKVIIKFKTLALGVLKDNTEEISKFVKNTFRQQSKRAKRLVDSFPNFKIEFDIKKLKNLRDKIPGMKKDKE